MVAWVLGAPQALGLNLYTEQFLAAVLGEAMALAFLKLPARMRAAKARVPWRDWLAAAAALGACGTLALRYDSVVTESAMRPHDFVALAALLVLLSLETTRRASGMSLLWYAALGAVYSLWGDLIPAPSARRTSRSRAWWSTSAWTATRCWAPRCRWRW